MLAFKKAVAMGLCVLLLISAMPASAAPLNDIDDSPYRDAILFWVDHNILLGRDTGNFDPNGIITRAELAAILGRVMGFWDGTGNAFSDLSDGRWYYDAMLKAVKAGAFIGDGDTIAPDAPITRAEICAVFSRIFLIEQSDVDAYPGESMQGWAVPIVNGLAAGGYLKGLFVGEFAFKTPVTRGETAQLLFNCAPNFISQSGSYTSFDNGNVIVNVPDVVIDNAYIDGNLILAEGLRDGKAQIIDSDVTGVIAIRGGSLDGVAIEGQTTALDVCDLRGDRDVDPSANTYQTAANSGKNGAANMEGSTTAPGSTTTTGSTTTAGNATATGNTTTRSTVGTVVTPTPMTTFGSSTTTPRPTATLGSTATPRPTATPSSTRTPTPMTTPSTNRPTATPKPSSTPTTTTKPSSSQFEIDYAAEVIRYNGTAQGIEYKTNTATRWTALSATTKTIDAKPYMGGTLQVRAKATSTTLASDIIEIVVPARPTAPAASTVRFDGTAGESGRIVGLRGVGVADAMEVLSPTATGGRYTAIGGGMTTFNVTPSTKALPYKVRIAATPAGSYVGGYGSFASTDLIVTVPAMAAKPNVTYNASSDTITGVAASMEIYNDWSKGWEAIGGTSMPRVGTVSFGNYVYTKDGKKVVTIRTKATATTPYSQSIDVAISDVTPDVPVVSIDYGNEALIGWVSGMEYALVAKDAAAPTTYGKTLSITNGKASLSGVISATTDQDLYVRYKAATTGTTRAASAPAKLTLPKRPAAPTATGTGAVKFNGMTEKIESAAAGLEARAGTDAYVAFSDGAFDVSKGVTKWDGSKAVTFNVRVKAIAGTPASGTPGQEDYVPAVPHTFASNALSVSVPARPAAPSAVYAPTADSITGLNTTTARYKIGQNGVETIPDATSIPRSKLGNDAVTVYVWTHYTATTPRSVIKEIRVPAVGSEIPSGLTIDWSKEILSGTTTLMEYQKTNKPADGVPVWPTTWTACTADLPLASLIPASTATGDVVIRVRYKAVTTGDGKPASSACDPITLPKRPTAPTSANVKYVGDDGQGTRDAIIGVNNTHQYKLSTATEWTVVGDGVAKIGVTPNESTTASQTYNIRVAPKDGQSFASTTLNVTVPARAAASTTIQYAVASDAVTGVSTAMEWATTSDFAAPKAITGTRILRTGTAEYPGFGNNATIYVRTKATATAPYSKYTTVTGFAGAVDAPTGLTVDYAAEKLMNTTTAMEYQKATGLDASNNPTWSTTWTACTADLPLASLIPAYGTTAKSAYIRVRLKAANGNPPSAPTAPIELKPRPATPVATDVKFVGSDGTNTECIVAANSSIQYEARISTTSTTDAWQAFGAGGVFDVTKAVTAWDGTIVRRYSVRVAANTDNKTFSSAIFSVTAPARGTAPSVTYNATTGIVNTTESMEYSASATATAAEWRPCASNMTSGAFSGSANDTYYFRTKATDTAPASVAKSVVIPTTD